LITFFSTLLFSSARLGRRTPSQNAVAKAVHKELRTLLIAMF
jgi:hypothetical protein